MKERGTKIEKRFVSLIMLIMLCLSVVMTSCGQIDDTDKKGTDENATKIEKQIEKDGSANKDKSDKENSSTDAEKSRAKKNTTKSDKAVSENSGSNSGSSADNAPPATEAKVCYITIDGYCSGKAISIQGGDTAYSILTRSGARVSGSGSYVKGINGLYEFDKGPQSGWKYSVNGYTPNVGAGSYSVDAGDSVRWYYVMSY